MAETYSTKDLELSGLAVNIALFKHLLVTMDFDCNVALGHIIKSKSGPPSLRVKRLWEIVSAYMLNLYYIKSKDMTIYNFLSQINVDNVYPGESIQIYFSM